MSSLDYEVVLRSTVVRTSINGDYFNAFVFGVSLVLWFALKLNVGIHVRPAQEYESVDMAECAEQAYPKFMVKLKRKLGFPQ